MTVEELFRRLSYGELSNLAVAVDSTGTIKKAQQNRVLHFVNEALLRLHTRFPLSQTTLSLTMGTTELVTQLPTDTLQVLSILDDQGHSLIFTTTPVPKGIYVSNGELHIPETVVPPETVLQVILQTRHPTLLPINVEADLDQVITLIPELEAALTGYIASKMYAGMNSPETANASAQYLHQYEATCAEVLMSGLLPTEILPMQKFESRGWI